MRMIIKKIKQLIPGLLLALGLTLSPGLYSTTVMADDGAQANVLMLSSSMQFTAPYSVSGLSGMRVRIATPNDETVELSSNGGAISWSTAGFADGEYSYQVNILAGEDNAQAAQGEDPSGVVRVGKTLGSFTISNGLISQDSQTANWLDDLNPVNLLGTALEWLVPQTIAANIVASSTNPHVYFDDTDETGTEWSWYGNESFMGLYNWDETEYVILIDDRASMRLNMDHNSFAIQDEFSNDIVDIHESAPLSLVIDSDGDVKLVNGNVFVDNSTNRIGIGTTVPQQEVHIDSSSTPTIRLDSGAEVFDLGVFGGDFNIGLITGGQSGKALTIEDHNGYVGIWEENPESVLDVKSPDGVAQIRVEDTAGANNTVGTTINNINNGPASMRFHDTYNNETLIFRTTKSGGIAFDNPDSVGEIEFAVEKGGRAKFTGDVLVDGVVVHASSRELKENFKLVDPKDALDKVNALEIAEWNYIDTDDQIKHIGPVAEEFYEAFNLGETRNGISSVDSAGVALLAIQGLSQQLNDKDRKIEALRLEKNTQVTTLETRVSELEHMVTTTLVALKIQQSLNNDSRISMTIKQ